MQIDLLKRILSNSRAPERPFLWRRGEEIVEKAREVKALFSGRRRRSITVVGSRAHVGYRGVPTDAIEAFADAVTAAIQEVPEIVQAHVNPYTRRVVFRMDGRMPTEETLSNIVSQAESAIDANPLDDNCDSDRELPDDPQQLLEYMVESAADVMGLATGIALHLVPLIPSSVGSNLYSLTFLLSIFPEARRALYLRYGKERTDLLIHLTAATALGLGQRPLTAMVQLLGTVERMRELHARSRLWRRMAPELLLDDPPPDITALRVGRPVPIPPGPIERYEQRAKVVAACTFGFSLLTTRSLFRAIPAAFAAMPYPAKNGREIFVSEIGRIFAKRGMLVLAPEALHRLDRVDCLVIPSDLVSREQFKLIDAFALQGVTREDALEKANSLFRSEHPLQIQQEGNLTLGPVKALSPVLENGIGAQMAERANRGALILGLRQDDQIIALLEVHIITKSSAAEAIRKANSVGISLVLATGDTEVANAFSDMKVDAVIGLHEGLAAGIRNLQRDGRTVCFVGSGGEEGFLAADIGVAIRAPNLPTPWSAHILCPDSKRLLDTILDACAMARIDSRQSAGLALMGASMGALASTAGPVLSASGRVVSVMSGASLAAMINGIQRSMAVGRRRQVSHDPTPWHALEIQGVLARLGNDGSGLPAPERAGEGKAIDFRAGMDLLRAVRMELANPLTPLLAAGAGVSALVGSKADAGIVAAVGLINGVMGGYQRFRAERAISALVKTAETQVRVQRGEGVELCPAGELRRGDVLILAQGDVVPADARLISAESLEVDTSPLTGESLPVAKSADPSFAENVADISSMLYASNIVAAGKARAIVVATGDDTVMARASHLLVTDEIRGGVEARLRELMSLTGPVTLAAGVLLVASSMIRGKRVEDLVSTGVSLAVAAVPEGLPVLATAAQLAAAERLSVRGALVKNPRAIEALGRVDTLCIDKTGTLTEGRIALSSVHTGSAFEAVDALSDGGQALLRLSAMAVAREQGAAVDPMDEAIEQACNRHLEERLAPDMIPVAERAFESSRGFEAVLFKAGNGGLMVVKGAPELILSMSVKATVDGETQPIDKSISRLHENLDGITGKGLRVIAVATRRFTKKTITSKDPESLLEAPDRLSFQGFVAFRDPLRPTARATIDKLGRAGVRVVMLTGDHPGTAERVAREAGILLGEGTSLKGSEVSELTDAELDERVTGTKVFARVTPAQKVRVIRALERKGFIVGMVGDGANDAAAMGVADAGIAVGLHCTDAAKTAADIVLKDSRIDELFEVIVEGRAMWRSVRNAVSILVGGNFGEIAFSVAVGALTGRPPLSPRQLLVVNFLTDIAPSTAIALKPPSTTLLEDLREVGPKAALGSPLNREIVTRAITTSMGAWSAWLMGIPGGQARASTVGLLGLVGSQLGQTLLYGGKSRSVLLTGLGSFLLLGILVQTPGLSRALGCTPLGPLGWGTALTASFGSTLVSPLVDKAVNFAADRWLASSKSTALTLVTQESLKLAKNLLVI